MSASKQKPSVLLIGVGRTVRAVAKKDSLSKKFNIIPHSLILPMKKGIKEYIEEVVEDINSGKLEVDGIVGVTDKASLIASIIASKTDLSHPPIKGLLNCQNKYYSRKYQWKNNKLQKSVPKYNLLSLKGHSDPELVEGEESSLKFDYESKNNKDSSVISFPQNDENKELPFPLFIKPVKGSLSYGSKKVNSKKEAKKHLKEYKPKLKKRNKFYNEIIKELFNEFDLKNGYRSYEEFSNLNNKFLAESELKGDVQVTADGYVNGGEVGFFGITKSNFYEGTNEFKRFDYPFYFKEQLQKEVYKVCRETVKAVGLDNSLFNIEVLVGTKNYTARKSKGYSEGEPVEPEESSIKYRYNPINNKYSSVISFPQNDKQSVSLIEINSRPSAQFMYMIYKVTKTHPLEYAFNIALQRRSQLPKLEPLQVGSKKASCFILRTKKECKITKVPSRKHINELNKKYDNVRIKRFVRKTRDARKYLRYAQVKVIGNSQEEINSKFEKIKKELGYHFG